MKLLNSRKKMLFLQNFTIFYRTAFRQNYKTTSQNIMKPLINVILSFRRISSLLIEKKTSFGLELLVRLA